MGKKGHTSIVIEDHGQVFTQMTPRDQLSLMERDCVQDMRAGALAVLGPPEQLDVEDRQELEVLLKDKADGVVADRQALAQSPETRRLLSPAEGHGQTYVVAHGNKGPKVVGYDYHRVDENRGSCWKTPYPWIAGAAAGAVSLGVL